MSIQNARQLLTEVGPAMKEFTNNSLTVIYDLISEREGKLRGTGTFISSTSGVCLVSAYHVLYAGNRSIGVMKVNGAPPEEIHGTCYARGRPVDVAAIRVDMPRNVSKTIGNILIPLNESFLSPEAELEIDIYYVHGFPQGNSRFTAFLPGVISETMPYSTVLGSDSQYDWYNPNIHFTIEYPVTSEDESAREVDMPSPRGLSGALVWKTNRVLNDTWSADQARVVGIAHNWDRDSGCIVCTKIEHLCHQIERINRDTNH